MLVLQALSHSEDETFEIARRFATELSGGEFIAMYGDLGAGKTVFVRGLASILAPNGNVSSPSYSIVNEYGGEHRLCHFDMYRITGEDDLYSIGFYDYDDCIMAVEWSEKIADLLPECRYEVRMEKTGEQTRNIRIDKLP